MSILAPSKAKVSIMQRMMVGILFIAIIATLAFSMITYQQTEAELYHSLKRRAEVIGNSLLFLNHTVRSSADLRRITKAMGADHEVNVIAFVEGNSGKVLLATDTSWSGKHLNALPYEGLSRTVARSAANHKRVGKRVEHDGKDVTLFVQPSFIENSSKEALIKGFIIIAMNNELSRHALIKELWMDNGIWLLVIICIGLLMYILTHKYILRPVNDIVEAMVRRSKGEKVYAPVHSQDTIGVLAETLNSMLDHIEETQSFHSAVVYHAADGIVTVDQKGMIHTVNPAAKEIFGYDEEELIGSPISKIVLCPVDKGGGVHSPARCVESWVGKAQETMGFCKSEKEIYLNLAVSKVKKSSQELFACIIRDITDKKEYEEKLAKTAAELEFKNRDLQVARDQAEQATAAKSEFLANMSHELRSPLNGVLGFVDLMMDTTLTSRQKEYLKMVRMSAEFQLELINDILDLSKIDAQKIEVESVSFSLRNTIEDVLELLAIRVKENEVDIFHHYQPGFPDIVIGDPRSLRQILVNLIGNAIKFTSKGFVLLSGEVVQHSPEEVTVSFVIEDSGTGIPEEQLDRIFDSFTQADSSTKRKFGGTGLGLTICRKLAFFLGGNIEVQSRHGVGTFFTCSLPFRLPEQKEEEKESPLLKIGILSDSEESIAFFKTLPPDHFSVESFSSFEDALDMIVEAAQTKQAFDFFFMREKEYSEGERALFVSATKHECEGKQPYHILLTDVVSYGDRVLIGDMGFSSYLLEPIQEEAFLALIDTARKTPEDLQQMIHAHDPAEAQVRSSQEGGRENVNIAARVLVVEDNALNQRVALEMLQRLGCNVEVASNGKEALKKVQKKRYDLIFMDVQMPEMDGCETTQILRASESGEKHGHIIVAMTAHAMTGDREKYLNAGMDDYISKPIHHDELVRVLRKYISKEIQEQHTQPLQKEASSSTVVNFERLQGIFDGDKSLEHQMIQLFLSSLEEQLNTLHTAVDEKRYDAVAFASHTIKGGAANIGANSCADIAEELELAVREEQFEKISSLYKQLYAQSQLVQKHLKDYIST